MLFLNRSIPRVSQIASRFPLLFLTTLFGLTIPQSALASNITVASPVSGTSASSTVWVRAHNIGCNGLTPTAFGYSIDNSSAFTLGVTPYDIDVTHQSIGGGAHVVHFKSWTNNGICPVVDSTFTAGGGSSIGAAPNPAPATLPPNAASNDLDSASAWEYEHDGGTPGESRGSTVFPATTPVYDDAREFYMTYSNHGGERWHLSFGKNPNVTHFILDTYIYFVDPDQVQNLELDMNQVTSSGSTVIFGTQCSSISKTWEYVYVSGNSPHWRPSNIGCNPRSWAPNTWHHVQIAFHREGEGKVVHEWVNFDGTRSTFQNAIGDSSLRLGWAAGDLLVNYQLDGNNASSGSITSYVHKMTVASW